MCSAWRLNQVLFKIVADANTTHETINSPEINPTIRYDTVTQQNAALVEQAAAAAESLSDQTRNLAIAMTQFKT